jgi:exopolysaccharide biosynthesis predicted pyruvyltransferase EpsI
MGRPTTQLTLPPVAALLADYRGARAFFDPLVGNNGDRLIEMGSRRALADAQLNLVDDVQQAELIIMNGGYGISDLYLEGLQTLRHYGTQYPDVPLVVLPSSIRVDAPVLSEALGTHRAPTRLYAREEYTLQALRATAFATPVDIGLDHDMAFHLQQSAWFETVRRMCREQHWLIVERTDAEARTAASSAGVPVPRSFVGALPGGLRRVLRRVRVRQHRLRAARTAFALEARRRMQADARTSLPVYAADISIPDICAFDEFTRLIARSAGVATNRLHVAILAALLGKPTYLWTAATNKIKGIYEYSLRHYPNVQLVDG